MNSVQIKNVIFDVGNVLVRWSPVEIVRLTFGGSVESEKMAQMLFSSQIWKDLNKGTISEREAKQRYQREHQVTTEEMDRFFYYVKHTQILLYGSIELLKRVKEPDMAYMRSQTTSTKLWNIFVLPMSFGHCLMEQSSLLKFNY